MYAQRASIPTVWPRFELVLEKLGWHFFFILAILHCFRSSNFKTVPYVGAATDKDPSPFSVFIWEKINPLSPHDALKHHITPENRLNFPTTKGFRIKISTKLAYQYIAIFFNFFNHFKSSSSSTTSRKLRQQFAACGGWRWRWQC